MERRRGSQDKPGTFAAQTARLSDKIDSPLSIRSSVDALINLPSKVDELLLFEPTVEHLKSTVGAMQPSIHFFSQKYDSFLTTVTASQAITNDLRAETSTLKSNVADQSVAIKQL